MNRNKKFVSKNVSCRYDSVDHRIRYMGSLGNLSLGIHNKNGANSDAVDYRRQNSHIVVNYQPILIKFISIEREHDLLESVINLFENGTLTFKGM